METANSAWAVMVLGMLLSTIIPWRVGLRYPGMQTLCRRVSMASLAAALPLGCLIALLGVWAGMETSKVALVGSMAALASELAALLLFVCWLPRGRASRVCDEAAALRSLAILMMAARQASALPLH